MHNERDASVVIPCHNCAGVVERAFASAIHQTRPPRQIVLVDDASADDTPAVLRRLANASAGRAVIVTMAQNGGPSAARNAGWGAAVSRYVAFLDADDMWLPQKLETQMAWMDAHPECLFCGHKLAGEGAGSSGWRWVALRSLLFSNPFRPSTVMIRRDAPLRFNEGQRHSEDFALWLALVADGARAAVLNAPLAQVFETQWLAGGLSGNLEAMEKAELDNFRSLRLAKKITAAQRALASAWSLAKYGRRRLLRRFFKS